MRKQELLDRISLDPRAMAGQPCIQGTRLTVQYEAIASLSRLPLNALNRSPDPAEHYHSMDGYTRELWARAIAVASFAIRHGPDLLRAGPRDPPRLPGSAS